MFDRVRKRLSELRSETSGNATMLVAIGVPALIGSAGLAVDTSQWYMWKRELQYAVDQAALAGAYARANADTAIQATYVSRATQEYNRNLSVIDDIASTPSVALASYNGGDNNSVVVNATATQTLPFSSFLTGQGTTVAASAQAAYTNGEQFTACIIAVDPDDDGAITIGGSVSLTARCGIAALSTSDKAIIINGNPSVDPGWVVSAGGIDDWLSQHTDAEIHEGVDYLVDPFDGLNPPNNATPRTYTCVKGTKTTKANVQKNTETTYTYYKGFSPDANGDGQISSAELAAATWDLQDNSKGKAKQTSSTTQSFVIVENDTVDGVTTTTTRTITKTNNSSGANATWEMATTVTTTTQSGTTVTTTPDQATAQPGTYTSIKIACNTVFMPGIYVISGGDLDVNAQNSVIGNGVMFVLKNSAGFQINGGASINLTAMTASQLIDAGVSSSDADKLAGMLIFEDRNSNGVSANHNRLNGNAETVLNGTIYLPKSNVTLSGTASVVSQCLMIAAANITMEGNFNMSSFCPSGLTEDTLVTTDYAGRVRLVA